MKRIKLLYLIDQVNIGGTEKQLLAVVEKLDRTRFEPYLVCLRPTEYLWQCPIGCHRKVLDVTSLASWDGLKKLIGFAKYLRREKIDIIQTFFFDATVFGVLAARLARVKKVLSSRRDMGFWYTSGILTILFLVNLLTDRIVVNSRAIKENVQNKEHLSHKKIDVIYNGINLQSFSVKHDVSTLQKELGIPRSDRVVGIVANLNRRVKRVDLFIDAAAGVLKRQKDVSFVVVGEGGLRNELEEQATTLGISKKIYFVGSQDNIIPYLQLFDVGVLTSDSEGFPNAIVEYMAAGLPVVCFNSGGNRELVENNLNGCIFQENSAKSISDGILLLANDKMREKMKIVNIEKVKVMSWDIVIKNMQNFYSNLVKN